jgi:hypothetical protein
MPRHLPSAVCGLPKGILTVTDAPTLVRLRDLGRQARKIGRQIRPGKWQWFGDLDDPTEFKTFLAMRDQYRTLIQLTHYPNAAERCPILFARIADGVDPQQAYQQAYQQAGQKAAKVMPTIRTPLQQPDTGLGGRL